MKTIVLTERAARPFDDLPLDAQRQVSAGVDLYALEARGDTKALVGQPGFRLRIGR